MGISQLWQVRPTWRFQEAKGLVYTLLHSDELKPNIETRMGLGEIDKLGPEHYSLSTISNTRTT